MFGLFSSKPSSCAKSGGRKSRRSGRKRRAGSACVPHGGRKRRAGTRRHSGKGHRKSGGRKRRAGTKRRRRRGGTGCNRCK
jgi:hypothetical protein